VEADEDDIVGEIKEGRPKRQWMRPGRDSVAVSSEGNPIARCFELYGQWCEDGRASELAKQMTFQVRPTSCDAKAFEVDWIGGQGTSGYCRRYQSDSYDIIIFNGVYVREYICAHPHYPAKRVSF
jgi:hypothetical protein